MRKQHTTVSKAWLGVIATAAVVGMACQRAEDRRVGCDGNDDCPSGFVCLDAVCVKPCLNASDCALRQRCADGICADGECLRDDDCELGLVCEAQACIGGPEQPPYVGDAPHQILTVGEAMAVLPLASYTAPTNGDPIIGYQLLSGTLPSGLSLNGTTGAISGTPTAAGDSTVVWTAADDDGANATGDAIQFQIGSNGTPPQVGNAPDQALSAGVAFSMSLADYVTLTEGDPVTMYLLASGELPPGVTLNATTGLLAGTPDTLGTYQLVWNAADEDGANPNGDALKLTVTVDPCQGVDCGIHGRCAPLSGAPVCQCDPGFEALALSCVSADPGSGSWSPDLSASPRIVVVDQSGSGTDSVTVVPGCVNGGSIAYDASCRAVSVYTTTIDSVSVQVRLTQGEILSVRYPLSGTTASGGTGSIKLTNSVGGGIGIDTLISLSTVPGDLGGDGQPRCTNRTTTTPSFSTGSGVFACHIDRSKARYYLNIAVQQDCAGRYCIFDVQEGSSEFTSPAQDGW